MRSAGFAAGTLTAMPEAPSKDSNDSTDDHPNGVITGFGFASAIAGLIAVVAVVLGVMVWSGHRSEADERAYQSRCCGRPPTGPTS